MKKYRITRIRIKTREIVAISGELETADLPAPICPVCHSPLGSAPPAAEAEISTGENSGRIKQLKGDR